MKKIAWIISRLTEPFFIILPCVITLSMVRSGMNVNAIARSMGTLGLILFLPGFIGMSYSVLTHKVTNWDVSNRHQRIIVLAILSLLIAGTTIYIRSLHIIFLDRFLSWYLLWFVGVFLITFFYKISFHLSMFTVLVCLSYRWFGISSWVLVFCIPLVAWARIVLKRHTFMQVVWGVVYSLGTTALGVYLKLL